MRSAPEYPPITVSFSFSSSGVTPARPYWPDETEETLAAFKRGLEGG
ncbi:MAG: hypothetical protein GX936_03970 [Clostridiales bacterium]|jgi:hypothetical protein|nr:hypothetical protein [Clostridiales bacterium]